MPQTQLTPFTVMPSVRSVMTPSPQCVDADESLLFARALMQRHDVHHLPVVSGETVVGVVSDRDIKRALDPDLGLPPEDELFVRDVLVPDAYIVAAEAGLDSVLEHMATFHIGSALVTHEGHLAGIFTTTDACRAFCRYLRAAVSTGSPT